MQSTNQALHCDGSLLFRMQKPIGKTVPPPAAAQTLHSLFDSQKAAPILARPYGRKMLRSHGQDPFNLAKGKCKNQFEIWDSSNLTGTQNICLPLSYKPPTPRDFGVTVKPASLSVPLLEKRQTRKNRQKGPLKTWSQFIPRRRPTPSQRATAPIDGPPSCDCVRTPSGKVLRKPQPRQGYQRR